MSDGAPLRLGCLVSGGGRHVMNLQDCIARGELPATIAVVLATKPDAPAIDLCRARGLPVVVVPPQPPETVDDRVDDALRAANVELVVLAGYLRMFRVQAWIDRCINIHPALLPRHGGKGLFGRHVHEAVLGAGDPESGCTVHWVDERYDHGEAILQRRCRVLVDDTPEALADRVFAEELLAMPDAIRRVARWRRGDGSKPLARDLVA